MDGIVVHQCAVQSNGNQVLFTSYKNELN